MLAEQFERFVHARFHIAKLHQSYGSRCNTGYITFVSHLRGNKENNQFTPSEQFPNSAKSRRETPMVPIHSEGPP